MEVESEMFPSSLAVPSEQCTTPTLILPVGHRTLLPWILFKNLKRLILLILGFRQHAWCGVWCSGTQVTILYVKIITR